MKLLKFKPHLVQQILDGVKRSTWRLFDDKDLTVGDELNFINSDTGEEFGIAKIMDMRERTLGTVTDEDFEGHERYSTEEEMYEHYREYYGDKVGPDTPLKIIKFEFSSHE